MVKNTNELTVLLVVLLLAVACPSPVTNSSNTDEYCRASLNTDGTCNAATFPTEDPKATQKNLLDEFTKILKIDYSRFLGSCQTVGDPNSNVVVSAHFSCSVPPPDGSNNPSHTPYVISKCGDCFGRASDYLKDWCSGRVGGIVSFDDCCLRYEVYDICTL